MSIIACGVQYGEEKMAVGRSSSGMDKKYAASSFA